MDTKKHKVHMIADSLLFQYNAEPVEQAMIEPFTFFRKIIAINAAPGVTEEDIVEEYTKKITMGPDSSGLAFHHSAILLTTLGENEVIRVRLSVDGATSLIMRGTGPGMVDIYGVERILEPYDIKCLARELVSGRDREIERKARDGE